MTRTHVELAYCGQTLITVPRKLFIFLSVILHGMKYYEEGAT